MSIEEEIDNIVDSHLVKITEKEFGEAITKAEAKKNGEDNGCYCSNCLRNVAFKANQAIWGIICENPNEEIRDQLYEEYHYEVIPNGLHSKLIQGSQ